jgi:glycosyltransferase involved in cell wall biosynthesis
MSALSQTYANVEVIAVDDGSTDSSLQILKEIASNDARLRVIHQDNSGISAAQNAGLDASTGEYVTFLDNDDLLAHTFVEVMLMNLTASGADLATCRWFNIGASEVARMQVQSGSTSWQTVVYTNPAEKYQSVQSVLSRKLRHNGEFYYMNEANWSKLYRRELFDGIRFPDGQFAQDICVAMELYLRAKTVVATLEPLYFWLQHPGSASHQQRSENYHADIFSASRKNFILALEHGIVPARSYYQMVYETRFLPDEYRRDLKNLLVKLPFNWRVVCRLKSSERLLETQVYNLTKHRRV